MSYSCCSAQSPGAIQAPSSETVPERPDQAATTGGPVAGGHSSQIDRAALVRKIKRLVVKVGTSSLTYGNGKINISQMDHLVRQMADVRNRGIEVVLVTSGAIAAGMGRIGLNKRPPDLASKQALAAVGQGILMQMYEKLFSEYGYMVGQVLLTREDISSEERRINIKNTFDSLLNFGVIPIVNENDTVAVEEIRFGDNDTLSALVATLINAELLILLSDIDGLYTEDPRINPEATLIPVVTDISNSTPGINGGTGSSLGVGGMRTKIEAARIATARGVNVIIANSSVDSVILEILDGKPLGTLFVGRFEA
ncbi:MAG TPA: glutamate 5-kinase [Firmicutes bacterium]|nr:glutamate 5-kinase [Bacillota bacterium]